MFTGLIEGLGRLAAIENKGGDARMLIDTGNLDMADGDLGDSIAVNGVCLTVQALQGKNFYTDVSHESLSLTTLGDLQVGDLLNLEKALLPTTRLGGHLVSGHVDGVGEVLERTQEARSWRFRVRAPDALARYIAKKGSICIDGTSLTINQVTGAEFTVNIIPHTLEQTIIHSYQPGRQVNLEVDLIARYLERLLLGDKAADAGYSGITSEFLAQQGYINKA